MNCYEFMARLRLRVVDIMSLITLRRRLG